MLLTDVRESAISQTVEKALREQCGIPAKSYFVAAILEDGQTCYFTGPDPIPSGHVPKFFNEQAYVRYLGSQGSGASDQSSLTSSKCIDL